MDTRSRSYTVFWRICGTHQRKKMEVPASIGHVIMERDPTPPGDQQTTHDTNKYNSKQQLLLSATLRHVSLSLSLSLNDSLIPNLRWNPPASATADLLPPTDSSASSPCRLLLPLPPLLLLPPAGSSSRPRFSGRTIFPNRDKITAAPLPLPEFLQAGTATARASPPL